MSDGSKGNNPLVSTSVLPHRFSFSNHSTMKGTRTLIEMMPFGPGARNAIYELIAFSHPVK